MERQKLDNGLLPLAFITNILIPCGLIIYFAVSYLQNPVDTGYLIPIFPLSIIMIICFFLYFRFKKIEFDDSYVYVKNVFNTEIDSFPIKNIRNVEQMMFTSGKGSSKRSGKNYKIMYINNDGVEKTARVMATIKKESVEGFQKATAFLGENGFDPF
jgi:hypothetical protein